MPRHQIDADAALIAFYSYVRAINARDYDLAAEARRALLALGLLCLWQPVRAAGKRAGLASQSPAKAIHLDPSERGSGGGEPAEAPIAQIGPKPATTPAKALTVNPLRKG